MLDALERSDDFFRRIDLEVIKKDSKPLARSSLNHSLLVTHFAKFGIECSTTIDFRALEIEFYSDQSLRIFFPTVAVGNEKNHFLSWYLNLFVQEQIWAKGYTFSLCDHLDSGSHSTPFLFESIDAFKTLMTLLEDKIPKEMHTDLITILNFITHVSHQILDQHRACPYKIDEQLNQIFALVRQHSELGSDSCINQHRSGRLVLIQPVKDKQALTIQHINNSGDVTDFYLVRHKYHGGFRLLNSYNKPPFKAYDQSIKQQYELVYEESLHWACLDIDDNGLGHPDYPLFKKNNNHWQLTQNIIPYLSILPIKEFDWLIAHTPINPYQVDSQRYSLFEYVIRKELADCLGTLLSYSERFTASSRYTIPSVYKILCERIQQVGSGQLQAHPQLSKMWRYFQPPLRKTPPIDMVQPATQIQLISNRQYIQSTLLTSYKTQDAMEFDTLFKPASLLKPEEKEQFLSLVEGSFNSLITEQDRQIFAAATANIMQPLSNEAAIAQWCSLIENKFNCTLSQEKRSAFLKLMSKQELADFHRLIHHLSDEQSSNAFWDLISRSIVRFSFTKDISGPNKFVELVYKKSHMFNGDEPVITKKLIAGLVHELVILPEDKLKKNKRVVWHYALAAKSAGEPTPAGLIPFLIFRGPLSLGLNYDVIVIGFTLNTSSYAFIEQLNNYFPKYRSQQRDELAATLIKAIHGKNAVIYQDGMGYYIQDCIQGKGLAPSSTLSKHAFTKLNSTADEAELKPTSQSLYRAVPTFFSASDKENRKKLNKLLPSSAHQEAHLKEFLSALEPLVEPVMSEYLMPLAKL